MRVDFESWKPRKIWLRAGGKRWAAWVSPIGVIEGVRGFRYCFTGGECLIWAVLPGQTPQGDYAYSHGGCLYQALVDRVWAEHMETTLKSGGTAAEKRCVRCGRILAPDTCGDEYCGSCLAF